MDFATGSLSSLLPKLAKLLQDEYKLHKGARKGIEFLHKELETMHAVLRKVGDVPREQLDEMQMIWTRDVRELSYDMEDIVDTFMVDVEGPDPPSKRGARKIFNKMIRRVNKAMARREVAQHTNDIKERIKELAERRDRLLATNLIDLVRESLQKKRYLIVIDDIWDKEPWDKVIGLCLIENNMRSRIITTTRIFDVAEHVGRCYRLKPLSDKSSKMLFYGRVFGSQDKCPSQFSKVSKKILKKCGGVPLAIVTTSSLLANKAENIKVWEDVCDSIGLGLGTNNPGMDDMWKILLLSYYDLPSDLKTCLLYLSVFPEDYLIRKDRLIWRWVAEGFVQQGQQATRDQISLFEIGENYFNELLNRSLIQPADMDGVEGKPKACRLHDAVLDLVITLSVEECFITTVLGDGMKSKVRWLSLHSSNTLWPNMKIPKLRSLTICRPVHVAIDLTHSCYRLLRVLDLQGYRLQGLASLSCLGSLSHLRYFGVSSTNTRYQLEVDELPVEIGKLRSLQTLDISDTTVIEVPSSVIAGLGQLMCLRGTSLWHIKLPVGLKNLTSLEVLESVDVASERITEELGHLTKLRTLDVRMDEECGKALMESLGKLAKIESLNIYTGIVTLDGPMEKPLGHMCRLRIHSAMFLPAWINPASLPGLSFLDIVVKNEQREDIQILGTLPCLRHLKFKDMRYATKQDEEEPLDRCVVGPDAFPRAVRCEFDMFTGVAPSMFPRGAMPMLQDLTFHMGWKQFWTRGCISVDDLGLGHLPSLRRVAALGHVAITQEMVVRVSWASVAPLVPPNPWARISPPSAPRGGADLPINGSALPRCPLCLAVLLTAATTSAPTCSSAAAMCPSWPLSAHRCWRAPSYRPRLRARVSDGPAAPVRTHILPALVPKGTSRVHVWPGLSCKPPPMGMAAGHIVKLQLLVMVKVAALALLAAKTQRRMTDEATGDAMLTKLFIELSA
ncbi:hypothetical protein HU200_060932 [Digitaria exilis]|uniref:Uncharacterized protein n=1 Tax=Digitaria exilis TaxID=1010633 RepID=A0A835ABB5_9POAL|nr:hypothetical protein HU200_060932 [Digitaria exilis]